MSVLILIGYLEPGIEYGTFVCGGAAVLMTGQRDDAVRRNNKGRMRPRSQCVRLKLVRGRVRVESDHLSGPDCGEGHTTNSTRTHMRWL